MLSVTFKIIAEELRNFINTLTGFESKIFVDI